MKESRFVSPPGALKTSNKKVLVTEEDMKEGEERFQRTCKSMSLTPIDDATLELIRARKKNNPGHRQPLNINSIYFTPQFCLYQKGTIFSTIKD